MIAGVSVIYGQALSRPRPALLIPPRIEPVKAGQTVRSPTRRSLDHYARRAADDDDLSTLEPDEDAGPLLPRGLADATEMCLDHLEVVLRVTR